MSTPPDVKAQGLALIGAVERLVASLRAIPTGDDGILVLDGLEAGEDILPGETDRQLRKDLMAASGAIDVTRGFGGPARLAPAHEAVAAATLSAARSIWEALCAADEGYLSPNQLLAIAKSDALADRAGRVLKMLRLITGRRKVGGIQLAAAAEQAMQQAARQDSTLEPQVEADKRKERDHESVFYDAAADLLERAYGGLGLNSYVLGNRQLADGQWNTPDVIGLYLKPAGPGGLPVTRLLSVEVKWRLSRDAIAEAVAHRRFANYAFLFVPTSYSEIDPELVTECIQSGIGLMCPRQANSQTYYVQMEPPFHRPDEEWVDWFLNTFRADDGTSLAKMVATEARRALAAVLAG